jgi:hypothetical protein
LPIAALTICCPTSPTNAAIFASAGSAGEGLAGGNVIAVGAELALAAALVFGAALALAAALEEAAVFVAVDSLLSHAARTKTAEAMRSVRMAREAKRTVALNQQCS